jgi:hypothetical protein
MLASSSTPHIARFWGLASDVIYKEKTAISGTTLRGAHHSSSELLGRPSTKKSYRQILVTAGAGQAAAVLG